MTFLFSRKKVSQTIVVMNFILYKGISVSPFLLTLFHPQLPALYSNYRFVYQVTLRWDRKTNILYSSISSLLMQETGVHPRVHFRYYYGRSDVVKLTLFAQSLRITNYEWIVTLPRDCLTVVWSEIFLEHGIATARPRFTVARYDYTTPLRLVTNISLAPGVT